LVPAHSAPSPAAVASVLRLVNPEMQRLVIRFIMGTDRLRKEEAEKLGQAIAAQLGISVAVAEAQKAATPEEEQKQAWAKIKDLIARRTDAAALATAIRDRLHAKYNADEVRQSWLALIDADTIALIRVICQLPYLPDGRTDSIAHPVLETYISRLTHEKYATTYSKVVKSLKSMFHAKPDSQTLLTFLALVRWANPEAANKLAADIGIPAPV